ncbi:MAG: tetratricopeptide repeat protein [Thermoanaerobaculales bacterium]|jgi:tetratricopeptide (TPR) repeat protein|nr:tetratricopeptide repeat protein [Thermoanaerobaculales bacterium]
MSAHYDELMRSAEAAFTGDNLTAAAELYQQAAAIALEAGDQDRADHAFCNHCSMLTELDQGTEQIPKLKEILLRSDNPKNRFLAAYNTAVAYDLQDDLEKSRSYANRAIELSESLGEPDLVSRSANLAGTLAVRESRFDEADSCYHKALDVQESFDGHHGIMRAQYMDNLGYVMMCTDRLHDGIDLCEEARADLERVGADHYLYETLQDLCYGHLMADNLDRARECGEQALDLAIEFEDDQIAKNCLFLLSETAVRHGDTFRARRYLRELTAYYPEVGISEEIIDVFLATDLTSVVNLRG